MHGLVLKSCRIAVQMFAFLVLTLGLVWPSLALACIFPLLEKTQIVPALVAFSLLNFAVWLSVTLLFGRIYCSAICPLGTLQDLFGRAARIRRPVKRYRYTTPKPRLRYLFLVIMLAGLMAQWAVVIAVLDPYNEYLNMTRFAGPGSSGSAAALLPALPGAVTAAVVLVSLAVTSWRNGRSACNTVCPVGTALGLVSRYSVLHIDIDTDKCINCGKCADACKGQCIDLRSHVVDGSRCVDCFSCLPVCPNDAIHYTVTRKQLSIPMLQSIENAARPKQPALGINEYENRTE